MQKYALFASLFVGACAGGNVTKATNAAKGAATEAAAGAWAPIQIAAKTDSGLTGTVVLQSVDNGVRVVIAVNNVSPGKHGAHIHEVGDCSAPDGKSAGGHFNPGGHDHALPGGAVKHLGDLGNITVDAQGVGALEFVIEGANLEDGKDNSILGRSLIIHADEDDGGQPTGNAGGRIGCAELKPSM